MPIHGEYRHLSLHAQLAQSVGISKEKIFVLEDGNVLELNPQAGKITGKITSGNVYVADSGNYRIQKFSPVRETVSTPTGHAGRGSPNSHLSGEWKGRPDCASEENL
jgi:hypothetical protein